MKNAPQFTVRDVKYNYQESRQMGDDNPQQVPVSVKSADVTCLACNHHWTASGKSSGLHGALGGALIACPECEENGFVASAQFQE